MVVTPRRRPRSRHQGKLRVLVVSQTPPPYGGQAVMAQQTLDGQYENATLWHVRMAFSKDMDEVGKVRLAKLLHLCVVVARIWVARVRVRPSVIYYMPAGPDIVPMIRDLIVLSATRWMFLGTVFHFQAGGLSERYLSLPAPVRVLFRLAYHRPDVAIRTASAAPEDGRAVGAVTEYVIANSAEPIPQHLIRRPDRLVAADRVLYVGVLRESKGTLALVEACGLLVRLGYGCILELVGRFESPAFERTVRATVERLGMQDCVEFSGVLTGRVKHEAYVNASIFCFPTYFESESFPVAIVEAMAHGLPIVATDWRGVRVLVEDGVNGLQVPIRDPQATAEALARLIEDPELRQRLGGEGRRRYEERYTIDRYWSNLDEVFARLRMQVG
jgi:glycosyltransferase involved in cell wall biosynthesis